MVSNQPQKEFQGPFRRQTNRAGRDAQWVPLHPPFPRTIDTLGPSSPWETNGVHDQVRARDVLPGVEFKVLVAG